MTPQPAISQPAIAPPSIATCLTLDPATTHETLASIFGALRLDPARTPALQQIQRDAGALMVAALGPSNPVEAAYAVRATAAHFASMECSRRTTIPDTPDNVGQRWFGKALALSRMSTDLIDALTASQDATAKAQQRPAVRPEERQSVERQSEERLSQALAAELARHQTAAPTKAAEAQAVPGALKMGAPGMKDPLSSERPSVTPATSSAVTRPAAAVAAQPADRPTSNSAPDPRATASTPDPRDPLSSERPRLMPAGSAIMSGPAAVSCLVPTLPRPGPRAALLSATSLSSRVVPVPAAPQVTPAKPVGS